ncbi:hypothetical protein L204_100503 [Cryptococcus depauperatus]|nr:hypothetical protein L204_01567 [Cryptococcus depauperatus CBS 7855]
MSRRQLTTSATALASRGAANPTGLSARARPWSYKNTPKFGYDDTTSLGWLRMFRIQDAEGLVKKVVEDKEVLRAANNFKFTPPTAPIRLTTTLDLSKPTSRFQTKSVLLIPVASLPLLTPEALHRIKLLAGPRWTPGRPGKNEFYKDEEPLGKEGWIKISEERFENAQQNRRSASDMLERLVEAASDSKSPLSVDIPIDTRHLIARHRKKRSRQNPFFWTSGQMFLSRLPTVGGIKGFPVEWLPEEIREKAVKA